MPNPETFNHYSQLQAIHDTLGLTPDELARVSWDSPRMVGAREAAKRVLWVEISKLRKKLGLKE